MMTPGDKQILAWFALIAISVSVVLGIGYLIIRFVF